jgi:hypothetical protein
MDALDERLHVARRVSRRRRVVRVAEIHEAAGCHAIEHGRQIEPAVNVHPYFDDGCAGVARTIGRQLECGRGSEKARLRRCERRDRGLENLARATAEGDVRRRESDVCAYRGDRLGHGTERIPVRLRERISDGRQR